MAAGPDWMPAVPVPDAAELATNAYFDSHPEMVLGDMSVGRGMYNRRDLVVTLPPARLVAGLATARRRVAVTARELGLGWSRTR